MARVGFIGLGNMGLPMALNLLKAGHEVQGYDVNAEALSKLAAAGGTTTGSVHAASSGVDVVITMLPAGQHVRDVYTEAGGVLASVDPGTLLIDSSTIDVDSGQEIADDRCTGLRRRRRRAGGNFDLHGRRPGGGFRAREAVPRTDGQDDRPRR
jgi:3-hydroxyisobutyrate dehydrogenase-like beta-hydroxyacid dehydrogenase